MTGPQVFRVALDMPLRRLFDYLAPQGPGLSASGRAASPGLRRASGRAAPAAAHAGRAAGPSAAADLSGAASDPGPAAMAPPSAITHPIQPGTRVRVPFGRQRLVGVVIETADSSDLPLERLKPILEVLDPHPILDPAALGLLRWAAEYYHHPVGEVVSAAMPKALRLGASTSTTEERWSLTADGHNAHQQGEPKRAPKQRKLLDFLAAHDAATADALTEHVPNWRDAARQLVTRGWIGSMDIEPAAIDTPKGTQADGPPLSEEQKRAVQVVGEALNRYGTFVLLKPPFDTETAALWIGPFAALALGGLGVAIYLRQRKSAFAPLPETLSDAEQDRLNQLFEANDLP